MMRWFSGLCLLTTSTTLLAADDKQSVPGKKSAKIQVIALAIYKAPPPKPGTFLPSANGVNMEVMVSLPDQFITGIDVKGSPLDSFRDDADNVLFKKSGGLFGVGSSWLQDYGMRYGPDGESVTVQIRGTDPPGKGAHKILLKGSLNVKCGLDAKTTETKAIAMKSKEEAAVGPFKVQVNGSGGGVQVSSTEENIKKVEFFDDKNKPIATGPPSRFWMMSKKSETSYVYGFYLLGKREKFSIKVHYFNKVEKVKVPLDLRVGLDLE